MRTAQFALFFVLCATPAALAQSISSIGKFLEPWGHFGSAGSIAMTPDGVIAFVEEPFAMQCTLSFVTQRISIISADGTGYQVVVDSGDLFALPGPVSWTGVQNLKIAGDGGTLWFTGLHDTTFCSSFPPLHDFLADVETGSASLFTFNGADVGFISFTDDGQTMAFKGFDPMDNSWGFYLADVDGSNASKFLDTSPWISTPGVLSGDGTKFLFIGLHSAWPFPSDVYLYDFGTDSTLKLSPTTLNNISGASCSVDGARVVYHQSGKPLYAVNGDGSGHHMLYDTTGIIDSGTGTITRDGEWVFFSDGVNDKTLRIRWDGSGLEEVAPESFSLGSWMVHQPVNADGSVFGFSAWAGVPFISGNLHLSLLSPPALTTYGYGNPGTNLTWDVAGQPGDSYILAFSLNALSPGVGTQYGLLELDPARLFLLGAGPIAAPNNIGSMQVTIPSSLNLPVPLPVHFQALVNPSAGGGALTNMTTVLLQNAVAPLSAPVGGSGHGPLVTTGVAPGPWNGLPTTLTPEEQLWQLALQDPSLAARLPRNR